MMELWLHIVAFFEILFTRNVMLEVAALALCLGLGWFVGTRPAQSPAPQRDQDADRADAHLFPDARHGGDHPRARDPGCGDPRSGSALCDALRRHGARCRAALDRRLYRGAHRRAAVRRQSRQSIVDAAPGNSAHAVHLAGDCGRLPGLARSHHRRTRQHRHRGRQEPGHGVVGVEAAVHVDAVRAGGRLDQPLGRPPPEETQHPRAIDAHRPRQVRQRLLDRPQHSHGLECGGRRSHRLDGAHRRHRLGTGIRPAIDRGEFRERLRAADGPLDQAGRRHQPVGTERHEHGEFRLGAGIARPVRGGARPRRHRDAGSESAADLQCGDQLELYRSAHSTEAAGARELSATIRNSRCRSCCTPAKARGGC